MFIWNLWKFLTWTVSSIWRRLILEVINCPFNECRTTCITTPLPSIHYLWESVDWERKSFTYEIRSYDLMIRTCLLFVGQFPILEPYQLVLDLDFDSRARFRGGRSRGGGSGFRCTSFRIRSGSWGRFRFLWWRCDWFRDRSYSFDVYD